jgi:hypothetical protein
VRLQSRLVGGKRHSHPIARNGQPNRQLPLAARQVIVMYPPTPLTYLETFAPVWVCELQEIAAQVAEEGE